MYCTAVKLEQHFRVERLTESSGTKVLVLSWSFILSLGFDLGLGDWNLESWSNEIDTEIGVLVWLTQVLTTSLQIVIAISCSPCIRPYHADAR